MKISSHRRALTLWGLVCVLMLTSVDASAQVTVFRQRVYDAIHRGLDYLARQQDAGGLGLSGYPTNTHGLVAAAFLDQPRTPAMRQFAGFSRMPPRHRARVVRLIREIIDDELMIPGFRTSIDSYRYGEHLMALSRYVATGGPLDAGARVTVDVAFAEATRRLASTAHAQHGGFRYHSLNGGTDISASHFGWVGLSAARPFFPEVMPVLRRGSGLMRGAMNADGGLRYLSYYCQEDADCISDCAAPGVSCTCFNPPCTCNNGFCEEATGGSFYFAAVGNWVMALADIPLDDPDRQRNLHWIRENYASLVAGQGRNPNGGIFPFTGWALVKGLDVAPDDGSGAISNADIGGVRDPVLLGYPDEVADYYFDQAIFLLRNQMHDGRWNAAGKGTIVGTSLAILTLERSLGGCVGGDPDGDGICFHDNCPDVPNPDQDDADGDGVGDLCDPCPYSAIEPSGLDADDDGHDDVCDTCPTVINPRQRDRDADGYGDLCDVCMFTPNPGQEDGDVDGVGDVCDNCPEVANADQADHDGNGLGDVCQCADGDVCDGLDDDCDGIVDEDGAPAQACDSGADGVCGPGTELCMDGAVICRPNVEPGQEACDGLDNDCDGHVDELPPLGPCRTQGFGQCGLGQQRCRDGERVCESTNGPEAELCDGRDNNCNGQIDEGNPEGGADCSEGRLGNCAGWRMVCIDGALRCDRTPPVAGEECNGLDDDCDGQVDEGAPGSQRVCETEEWGICHAGSTQCLDGAIICAPNRTPEPEKCNLLDDDCDGVTDEVDTIGQACFTRQEGICADGTTQCVRGVNQCVPIQPSVNEICDGLDNDCDGQVDELNPGGGEACETGMGGVCAMGLTICEQRRVRCLPSVTNAQEVCDGIDQDCDGRVDEGARTACGGCLEEPQEVCDGRDQDCDGLADEDARCAGDGFCVWGACRDICGDAPCADGLLCLDDYCVDACAGIECDPGYQCRLGRCVNRCDGVECAEDEMCADGACVDVPCVSNGCPDDFSCVDGACVPNPCADWACPPTPEGWTRLCRDGECVQSCALVHCPPGEVCVDGRCDVDSCESVQCGDGQVCSDGLCVPDCGPCPEGAVCASGVCRSDPCETARCAPAERCVLDHRARAQCEPNPEYAGQPSGQPQSTRPDAGHPPVDLGLIDARAPPVQMDVDMTALRPDQGQTASPSPDSDSGCVSVGTGPQTFGLWFLVLMWLGRRRGRRAS